MLPLSVFPYAAKEAFLWVEILYYCYICAGMKVVVASDKFKGSLSSREAADAIASGILSVLPDCDIVKLAVADGGDGTADALVTSLGGFCVEKIVAGPLFQSISARYGVVNGDTAVLDVASASGLALLSKQEMNPLKTTSLGTGELIRDAIGRGYRKFMLGLGGSATNDAGMGILCALGYRFLDDGGNELKPCGASLAKVRVADASAAMPELRECEFVLLCDVSAAFYGKEGAAYVFAPQKGASDEDVRLLDDGLRSFAGVLENNFGKNPQDEKYSGAAGGIAGGLWCALGAEMVCGTDAVLQAIDFERYVADADFVVTGEGMMDRTTLLGKAPYGVCRASAGRNVPVIAFAAVVDDSELLNKAGFTAVFSILPGVMEKSLSMQPDVAYGNLCRAASQVFRLIGIL